MSKAQSFLTTIREATDVVVAFHNPGYYTENVGFYKNADIIYFELWNLPSDNRLVRSRHIADNYIDLWNRTSVLNRSKLTPFNLSKKRVGYERVRLGRVYIPESVWMDLKIYDPRTDQKMYMAALNLLFLQHSVGIVGMRKASDIYAMKH